MRNLNILTVDELHNLWLNYKEAREEEEYSDKDPRHLTMNEREHMIETLLDRIEALI